MSLIALVSAKGAPGVSLTALALAAAWPVDARHKVLLEADPSGGSLAVSYQLGRQPGLITLAAAGGHSLGRNDLWSHVQELPGGLGAIVAPERGDRARTILDGCGTQLGNWLGSFGDVMAIADCGRIAPSEVAGSLASQADRVFVLAQPRAEQIQPAAVVATEFAGLGVATSWVLIGDSPHSALEVAEVTGINVAQVLPDDQRGAQAIVAGQTKGRRGGRLARSISSWAQQLAGSHDSSDTPELTADVRTPAPLEEAIR